MPPYTALAAASALMLGAASAADVFAHFMVQNAYAYDVDQWKADIASAQQINVDGFALNWIPPDCQDGLDWTVDRIDDAFNAAQQMNFKLMYSFDMSYSECNIYWNQSFMGDMISKYAGNSATYRWNSNILVSTYGGDQVEQYGNEFFQGLKSMMAGSNAITLAPGLTTFSMGAQADPTGSANDMVSQYSSADGYLNWQAWPLNVDQNITVSPDKAFQTALKSNGRSGPYIATVSPWQYKDLNNGNPLDSWVAYSDTLFVDRFKQIATSEVQPDIIEILTWNDFCESHYLRDLPDQNNESAKDFVELGEMGNYVWGQNHAPWRIIAKYYISWWKTGSPPAATMDQVVFWHRVHPKDATCSGGSSTGVRNYLFPHDAVFAWALVTKDSTISMSAGSNEYWHYEVKANEPTMGFVPFPSSLSGDGAYPEVAIMQNGKLAQYGKSSQPIQSSCSYQNFNPVVNLVGPGINTGN